MKGTLEFELPEEVEEFELAQKGSSLIVILQDYDNYLRSLVKHSEDEYSEIEITLAVRLRKKLYELAEAHGVDIWNG